MAEIFQETNSPSISSASTGVTINNTTNTDGIQYHHFLENYNGRLSTLQEKVKYSFLLLEIA